jgi:signal transduction histidine kinase
MKLAWANLGRSLLPDMRLRWRLAIAFMAVGALPVLIACYIAADTLSASFADNMERWLVQAASFFAARSIDDEMEARQAAGIVAANLGMAGSSLDRGLIDLSAHLLTSVGYDAVVVYDGDGHVLFSNRPVGDGVWLPRGEQSGFFPFKDEDGRPRLLMGASQRFERDGRNYYAFVGDRWDGTMINMADSLPGLVIEVYAVADGQVVQLGDGTPLPPDVLAALAGGARTFASSSDADDDEHLAAGFAALRDLDGQLVGVVACRVASELSLLSHVRTLPLFLAMASVAAIVALLVALWLSKLISQPIARLIRALRRVREGDFQARVPVEGGGELTELAAGFNAMTTRLEVMREREAQVRRREQLATLGEAAAVLAHEIRNPLGIIKTSSQVLRMKSALPPEGEKLVGFVLEEVGRIDHLVQDLLDFARPRILQRRPVDVALELYNTLSFAAHELEKHGILVERPGLPGTFIIQADAEQLHQVFLNIVLNAMDAMPDGGTLTTQVEREGDRVLVSIADTGTGIDPEVRERLFEPFVTTKPRGTGLGLARVRHIVEQHGGTVTCDSEPGVGTCFTLRLPSAPPEQGRDA